MCSYFLDLFILFRWTNLTWSLEATSPLLYGLTHNGPLVDNQSTCCMCKPFCIFSNHVSRNRNPSPHCWSPHWSHCRSLVPKLRLVCKIPFIFPEIWIAASFFLCLHPLHLQTDGLSFVLYLFSTQPCQKSEEEHFPKWWSSTVCGTRVPPQNNYNALFYLMCEHHWSRRTQRLSNKL